MYTGVKHKKIRDNKARNIRPKYIALTSLFFCRCHKYFQNLYYNHQGRKCKTFFNPLFAVILFEFEALKQLVLKIRKYTFSDSPNKRWF